MNQDSNDSASDSQPEANNTSGQKSKRGFASMADVASQAKQKAGKIASSAAGVAGQALGATSETTKSAAGAATDAAGHAIDVASDTTKSTAGAVGEGFDVVSGKKLLQLVEERLELQTQYNDILATKLEEALRRIAALEEKVQ